MLVELANEFIALVVSDGEDDDHGVCPANAAIQLLVAAQAILMHLKGRESKVNGEHCTELGLSQNLNSKEPRVRGFLDNMLIQLLGVGINNRAAHHTQVENGLQRTPRRETL